MKLVLLIFLSFLLFACSKPKTVLICGDHVCLNNEEAEQFFEENLTLEVKIIDKNKSEEIDLIQLNLNANSKKQKEIEIFSKKKTNENLKTLSEKEKFKIRENIKKRKKEKRLAKRKSIYEKKNKETEVKKNIIAKKENITQNNVNKMKNNVVDVCTLIEKCNIKEISKYLIKEGKSKGFPDISRKQ